jgi:hypothetical protein
MTNLGCSWGPKHAGSQDDTGVAKRRAVDDRITISSAFVGFAQLGDHGEVFEGGGVSLDLAVGG